MQTALESLPRLFQWQDHDALINVAKVAKRTHLEFLTKRIALHAEQCGTEQGAVVLESLEQLPSENLYTVLSAPETCHQIYRTPTNGVAPLWFFLDGAISAEQQRLGLSALSTESVWTATGSHCFSASKGDAAANRQALYTAPCFKGLVIDTASPYSRQSIVASKFKAEFGASPKFTKTELKSVLFKCFCAVETLSSEAPTQWQFVQQLMTTVMPPKDMANFTFKGSSNRGIIGRANLINPQLDDVNFTVVANSFLHEAIHTLLYMCEEQVVFFSSDAVAFDARLQSPWSGNLINPRAYLHGCFVWFGLYQFWLEHEVTTIFNPQIRANFLELCSRGFREDAAVKGLQPFADSIRPDVIGAIEEMQQLMASSTSYALGCYEAAEMSKI